VALASAQSWRLEKPAGAIRNSHSTAAIGGPLRSKGVPPSFGQSGRSGNGAWHDRVMHTPLENRRAVVTGGTRGIGRAIVEALLADGAVVTFCGTTQQSVNKCRSEISHPNVFGVAADVSSEDDVSSLFAFAVKRMGGVDILVANAGIGIFAPAGDLTVEQWKKTLDVNLTGAYLCARAALASMRNEKSGHIVFISSLAAKNPFAGGAAYNASKSGMNGMSEAIMLDHRYDGIRITEIMPGSVDTDFSPRSAGKPSSWKIQPSDVAEATLAALRMPERTLISRIEMRPSRPQKG